MNQIAWIGFCVLLAPTWGDAAERFTAKFADESQWSADEIKDWCDPAATPTLAGRELFDDAAPLRWLTDHTQPPASPPTKYVEFTGGDRLAGEVLFYRDGSADRFESTPPHLLMKPFANVSPPEITHSTEIRVTLTWVRRIVWNSATAREYKPATIWPMAGSPVAFRSLRWTESGLIALTPQGLRQFAFAELSELHLPLVDPWAAYFEQLAWLSPDVSARLIQLDQNDGSRLTTSLERFQPRHVGEKIRPENWFQLIQPAWSLDPIWLRFRAIRHWLCFSPTDVPLSRFAPVRMQHQAVFGSSFGWRIDQTVLRTPLRSAGHEFGWGWGAHGSTDLEFELPEIARAIRTRYGLDRSVGEGGCVDVSLLLDNGPAQVNQRKLTGSQLVGDSQWIELPDDAKRHQVTFRTEMAHEGRPAGADPFDIRDVVNWYEPEVRLDHQRLSTEVAKTRLKPLTGLNGWTISTHNRIDWKTANVLDTSDNRDPLFRITGRAAGPFYSLSRQLKIGMSDRWLTVAASRFAERTSSSQLQVRIDGRVRAAMEIPIRDSMADPQPLVVPIQSWQGRTVTAELIIFPTDGNSWIDWRGIFVGAQNPGILPLFEDEATFVDALTEGNGRVELDATEHFSGHGSLKVSSGSKGTRQLDGLNAEVVEFPRLGQYRYVAFAWKKPSGVQVQFGFANQGRLDFAGPPLIDEISETLTRQGLRRSQVPETHGRRFGYRYEVGVATTKAPAPLWMRGDLPKDWSLVTRDLFADFGSFVVTGVTLNSVDENSAWFDHLILARTRQDLEQAFLNVETPVDQAENLAASETRAFAPQESAVLQFSEVAPQFSPAPSLFQLTRLPDYHGQKDVLQSEIPAGGQPLTLRAGIELSSDPGSQLEIVVANLPDQGWPLVVRINGEIASEAIVDDDASATRDGWVTVKADLSRFAGQTILVEVSCLANEARKQFGIWKRINLVSP
ncbi:hypothetical protein [Schlesneria paludicola]|uniref:hypothetical protein n=1 Tax=Schlesneria paludicola TaxID=360056 RepID=UPI00031B0E40|nr:hypothetical protein [Schlesneria paludicola]